MSHSPWVLAGSFEDRLRSVNLAISALAESLFDDDRARIHADAQRLQEAIVVVERSAIARGVGQMELHPATAAVLHQVQRVALPLLVKSGLPITITKRYLVRFRLDRTRS